MFNRSEMMKKEVWFFYGAKIPQTRQDRAIFRRSQRGNAETKWQKNDEFHCTCTAFGALNMQRWHHMLIILHKIQYTLVWYITKLINKERSAQKSQNSHSPTKTVPKAIFSLIGDPQMGAISAIFRTKINITTVLPHPSPPRSYWKRIRPKSREKKRKK